MPYFVRTDPPPQVIGDYTAFRPFVRFDFRSCCAYCLLHEFWAGGERNFELDHFRPVSLFPHLTRDFHNLYYACHVCNQLKHDHWPAPALEHQGNTFVDLCRDEFQSHYRLQPNGQLEPQTEAARYTALLLRLNADHLVTLRAFAIRHGFRLDSQPD
jgi:uncharacterized protein (TIGR02646 family)